MWQRFTERARRVVFYAQEEAQKLGVNEVGTEHMLLALMRDRDHVASKILLERIGVFYERIHADLERQMGRAPGHTGRDMSLTPRAKRVIDLAYEHARALSNNYIGTEHLLLGLIAEGESLAARILTDHGASLEATLREVEAMYAGDR